MWCGLPEENSGAPLCSNILSGSRVLWALWGAIAQEDSDDDSKEPVCVFSSPPFRWYFYSFHPLWSSVSSLSSPRRMAASLFIEAEQGNTLFKKKHHQHLATFNVLHSMCLTVSLKGILRKPFHKAADRTLYLDEILKQHLVLYLLQVINVWMSCKSAEMESD